MASGNDNGRDEASPRVVRVLQSLSGVLAIAVGAGALTVLIVGWVLGVSGLRSIGSGFGLMKANTAVGLVLLAAAVWLLHGPEASDRRRRAALALAVTAMLLAAVTLSQDVFGFNLGIDEWLFSDLDTLRVPGRMSPATAASFLLLGGALTMLPRARRGWQGLCLVVGAVALLILIGYAYGARALFNLPGYTSMAIQTAVGFLGLAVAALCARPEVGVMRVVSADATAGALTRRLLPAVVLVPLFLGWLRMRGDQAGWYQSAFGTALVAVANVLCIGAIAWLAAGKLLGEERDRRRAQDALTRSRRKQDDELRASEERKSAVLRSSLDCIISIDRGGRVIELNPAAERTFGYSRSEALGKPLADLIVPPRLRDAHRAGLARYVSTGSARVIGKRLELPAMRADGTEFPVEIAIMEVNNGPQSTFTGFIRDISDQKRAEEMRARSSELESENWRIQEASRLKSEFLANMSHELRTPLNSIIGFAELIYDHKVGPVSHDQEDFLGDILTSARHLLQLINDILDLSKVEAGKLEFHAEPLDVGKLVAEVAGIVRSIAAAKRIRLISDVDVGLGSVTIDAARLKQVLYNYLSNAIKFTPEGGAVTLRARIEDVATFRVEVEDTGPGIAPEDIPKLFVQFQQLQGKKHSGTGIGLALTKRLVEAQGGAVGVDSALGKGSTFFALLPREARTGISLPPPRFVPGPRADSPVVLVVEDDPDDQVLVVRTLSEAGYAVEAVATCAQALAAAREHAYDAVTLDLLLPDGSGLKVLHGIRGSARNHDVPVLVVSVMAERASVTGFALHDALPKPLDPERLLRSLRQAEVPPEKGGHILVVDDDASSLSLMEATLTKLGYRTTCVSDGERGLVEAEVSRPSAVVLDLIMPGMDGFTFLDRFRRSPGNRDVPVIIWTMKDLSPEEKRMLRSSADAVVRKEPTGTGVLIEVLRASRGARTQASGLGPRASAREDPRSA